jgi:hypothetical protein
MIASMRRMRPLETLNSSQIQRRAAVPDIHRRSARRRAGPRGPGDGARPRPAQPVRYQRIMRLPAGAGRPDAARRALSLLETRLTELGVTPGPQTRTLAASLEGGGDCHLRAAVGSADE